MSDAERQKALRELLKILSKYPEIAYEITIKIKPNSKPQQGAKTDNTK